MGGKALKAVSQTAPKRRRYTEEFRCEAFQMLLDGHSALSITERLGLSNIQDGAVSGEKSGLKFLE